MALARAGPIPAGGIALLVGLPGIRNTHQLNSWRFILIIFWLQSTFYKLNQNVDNLNMKLLHTVSVLARAGANANIGMEFQLRMGASSQTNYPHPLSSRRLGSKDHRRTITARTDGKKNI